MRFGSQRMSRKNRDQWGLSKKCMWMATLPDPRHYAAGTNGDAPPLSSSRSKLTLCLTEYFSVYFMRPAVLCPFSAKANSRVPWGKLMFQRSAQPWAFHGSVLLRYRIFDSKIKIYNHKSYQPTICNAAGHSKTVAYIRSLPLMWSALGGHL